MTQTADPATGVPARVELEFQPDGTRVRVPPGVTLFDAASWNGIAIDSTCGGHGTCKKCKIRITGGQVPASARDARASSGVTGAVPVSIWTLHFLQVPWPPQVESMAMPYSRPVVSPAWTSISTSSMITAVTR